MADGFKWCNSCGACLNAAAIRCRFCGSPLRADARISATSALNGVRNYSDACKWLPVFTDMVMALPSIHLKHMLAVCFEAETQEMKSTPNIDALIGYQLAPEPAVRDLIQIVLLNLIDTPNFEGFCKHPRLGLIDLSPKLIGEEHVRQQEEVESGGVCHQCGAHVIKQVLSCRFCSALMPDGEMPPPEKNNVDEGFIRALLLQIIARIRMNNMQLSVQHHSRLVEAHKRLMPKYTISDGEVTQEMIRLSNLFCPSWEDELPKTDWETKLIAADEPYKRTQYGVIRNILVHVKACALHSRFDEADQLLNFAANLSKEKDTDEFLADFMFAECIEAGNFMMMTKNQKQADAVAHDVYDENDPVAPAANLIKVMQQTGFSLMSSGLSNPNLLKELLGGTEEDRLGALDVIKNAMNEAAQIISKQLEVASQEEAAKVRDIMNSAAETVDASALSVKARGAFARGDYATAEQMARRALSGLTSDNPVVAVQRAVQYCFLAEIYTEQGKTAEAQTLLLDANAIAAGMSRSDAYSRSLIYRQVGAGYEKLAQADAAGAGYLNSAKSCYESSIADCEKGIQDMRANFPGIKFSGDLGSLLSVYAGVLKKLGLDKEAANAEARASELKGE
ncbi:MAG TPA: hypothetical protein V6C81_16405 [Planktothrix sp.]